MKPAMTGLLILTVAILLMLYLSQSNSAQGFQDIGETNERGTFTLYYADWCPHCKTVKPLFKEFMENGIKWIDGKPVRCRMVEEKERQKGVDPEVRGYPTLLYSDASGRVVEFDGPRNADGFMKFLREQILS